MVCKVVSSECSLFLNRFHHRSKWLIAHMWLSWFNGGFNVDCSVTCGKIGFLVLEL